MTDHLPYGRQAVDEEDIAAVAEVLRSDYLTTGPAVERFELALSSMTGAAHAVAVNSGTSALHAMYFAAGLEAGDEVITSPLTFAATSNAALYLGAKVRFVDVEPDTGNIDPRAVEAAFTERTKLVVAVDFTGHPADYDRLRSVADDHGATLLADAAHSLGASYKGRQVGTLAAASSLSFHPVKPVTTAEGGAVMTDDAEIAGDAALFRSHGITRAEERLEHPDEGPWWYEQHELGFNYRLTDVQAALGTSQLRKLRAFIEARTRIAAAYDEGLAGVGSIDLPGRRADVEPGWHLYVIRVKDPDRRRAVFEALRANGIGVQVHYLPVYWHPYYRELGFKRGLAPEAEAYYSRAISLPIFPAMTESDVARVVETVTTVVGDLV